MTKEEAREAIAELLEENEPEVVAQGFIDMYLDEKIEIEDLLFLVNECGFELDEKFVNASREEQKKLVEQWDEEASLDETEEDLNIFLDENGNDILEDDDELEN